MRKLMFAAALAAASSAFAVTSANIVGYSTITIPAGYSMFTPIFDNVDGTTFTLNDIIVCNADGVAYSNDTGKATSYRCRKLSVMKLKSNKLAVSDIYKFTTAGGAMWGANASIELESGEGVMVNNNNGFDITFRVSGGVQLKPVLDIPTGYSVWGNNTPVDYTLGDIKVYNTSDVEFTDDTGKASTARCRKLSVMKLKSNKLAVSDIYKFTTAGGALWGSNATIPFDAGEALIVYNNNGFALKFKLPEISVDAE